MYDSYPIFKHLNRVSILLILSITFLLPAGYFSSYYHRLQGQLAAETNYVASIVSDFIAHNPTIWSFEELIKIINKINSTELLCKKNPQIAKIVFFNLFSNICKTANNYS